MKARILSPEEWDRLSAEGLGRLLMYVNPENIAIVAVEDESGEIVACVSALRVTHFEGLWIKPEHRGNAGVFRSLIRQAYAVPQARGEKWALGDAGDEKMRSVCTRLGGQVLGRQFYALPVGG